MNIEDPVYIGQGFSWQPEHAQYAREIYARKTSALSPPRWYRRLRERLGLASSRNIHGVPWLHGLGANVEGDVYMDAGDMHNHIGIIGSTGAGKGRLMEPFLTQALRRPGETVIVVDPKLDLGMRNRAYGEMLRQGRPEDFLYFAPAHPEQSVRLNPMQNYAASSQLATRIIATLPPENRGDNFQSFVWKSINNVVQGMVLAGETPSLKAIRYLVEGGVEDLFVRAFERFMSTLDVEYNWRQEATKMAQTSGAFRGTPPVSKTYLHYYERAIQRDHDSEPLNGLRSVINHPGDHYQKMIVTIAPQLSALTTEEIGPMLSPDYTDADDPRPICNTTEIIRKGQVLYLALNSLADNVTAGWIGSLILSDLIAVAADRYNYEGGGEGGVTIIVDELSQVANEPFINLLSQARGAKFRVVWATQTVADLAVRFGSKDNAAQILGNVNTMFFLRGKDTDTKKYASEKMGTTRITSIREGHSGGTKTETMTDFTRSMSTNFAPADGEARVPPELFDELPDLHFFASLHDGRRMKLRMPFMQIEQDLEYPERPYGLAPRL